MYFCINCGAPWLIAPSICLRLCVDLFRWRWSLMNQLQVSCSARWILEINTCLLSSKLGIPWKTRLSCPNHHANFLGACFAQNTSIGNSRDFNSMRKHEFLNLLYSCTALTSRGQPVFWSFCIKLIPHWICLYQNLTSKQFDVSCPYHVTVIGFAELL